MCREGCNSCDPKRFRKFQKYLRALHCPTRWTIIRLLGEDTRGTGEIFEGLKEAGESLSKSGLYYHLSELEDSGIIELAGYREEGGGAPEKVWRLKTREIKIDLLGKGEA
ncbi:MAG: ArsR family transcriptional regulator [Candidatus Bathyarchaeia archaeon]